VLLAEIEMVEEGVRTLDSTTLTSLRYEAYRLKRLLDDFHRQAVEDMQNSDVISLCDLGDTVSEIVTAHQSLLEEQDIALNFNCTTSILIRANRDSLVRVIENLMQNSLRYTDSPGKLSITIKQNTKQAHNADLGAHQSILLVWEDSSPGVPDSELNKLFQPLYRVEKSRNLATGGSGLGLAIVDRLTRRMGGTVNVSRSDLGGLRFELVFVAAAT
jgi:two-component system sensor histidine kinase BaeS